MNYTLKAVPTAINKEQENLKDAKANQIVVGIDVHLQSYQAARKVDNAVVGVAQHFASEAALLVYMNKQLPQARRVAAVYEAGPLGYCLYRKLKALGVECYVCAADASRQQKQRRKTNKIDARNLTSNLWNFLSGNEQALQLVRIPTVAQEQARLESREKDWLVKERKRIGARGNSVLMSQGYGSWSNWWRPKGLARLSQAVEPWILKLLRPWVEVLRHLDQQILAAKVELAQHCPGARPKGVGAASLAQLQAEVLDWQRYKTRRKIGCLAGMVPSEWSTGQGQRLGSITKVGLPRVRHILTEMVWRIIRFQPEYQAVQKWREVLAGPNRALKKKAVVAIGRQLIVDLWRLQTGRVSAQALNLVMIGG